MRVLVLGASGFVGAHTYELLNRTRGVSVVGTYGRNPLFPDLQVLNLESAESVNDLMKSVQPDIVIWCAKHAPESSERPLNTVGLRTLMESAKPSMRLVFTSTDGLLLGTDGNYDESVTPVPINDNSSAAVYTNSKLEAEEFISYNWDNYCIARVGPIYGKSITGEWDSRVGSLVTEFSRGQIVYRAPNIRRTFIQVHDLAKALIELGQTDYRGVIHLGPTSVSNYFDFARYVCLMFGFEQHLVQPYTVSDEEIEAKAIRVDTTLDTRLADRVLKTRFHTVVEGLLDAKKWSGFSV